MELPFGSTGTDASVEEPARTNSKVVAANAKLSALQGRLGTLSMSVLETAASQYNLQVLDLKDNKIVAVPSELFELFAQVKVLDLRKNAIEELPPSISAMRALEDLLLDQNRLREIPKELCKLPCLKTLSLSQNMLRNLPAEIGEMALLSNLSIGDNQIEELPTGLGNCKALTVLYMHHNHFARLPTSLHHLEHLTELALEWFRYTTPPLPRVLKGQEWERVITKLLGLLKERSATGETYLSCIDILGLFSQKPFDSNAIDSKRRTRLHVACLEGHVGVAVALASNGSKCDSLDCEGYSPLLVAVREEHPEIAAALVRSGLDVNRGGGLFGSPLHVATVNFDPSMVMLLIQGKANVNQTDADGNTPLHVLMSVFDKGEKKAGAIGQILLRHSADCNVMNNDKWAPLHLAARRGQLRGICFVVHRIDEAESACLTCDCGHPKPKNTRVRTCTHSFDLDLRGGSHLWTPMHLAGHACHVPVVQVLIEAGAAVFVRNVDGRTARHVSRGNLAISKLLLKAEGEWLWYRIHHADKDVALGASASAPGGRQSSLLSLAATFKLGEESADDVFEDIVKGAERGKGAGGDRAPPDPAGTSSASSAPAARDAAPPPGKAPYRIIERCRSMALSRTELQQIRAANFADVEVSSVEEFAKVFVTVAQQGPKNRLPFFMTRPWVKAMLPKLLEYEPNDSLFLQPSLVNNEDFVRLMLCSVPRESLSILGKLRNKEQDNFLHVLCKGSSSKAFPASASRADILSLLLTSCPPETWDLEAQDLRGQTTLHLSAQAGDIGLVKVLLEFGADPNVKEGTTGWAPLHFAVAKGHYGLIIQLLHHEATNVNQVDKFDWPPLLEACSRLDARATSLLANGGADLSFRNQYQFDVLKAVDTSKKDLAAKRWMSCLVVTNGFQFAESVVQLSAEDRERLEKERTFFAARRTGIGPQVSERLSIFSAEASEKVAAPPFYVPDHLAPRCHACKVLFSVTVRRYYCRSCGVVLCGDCFKWTKTDVVPLDEVVRARLTKRPSLEAFAGTSSRAAQVVLQRDFEDLPLAEEVPHGGQPISAMCSSSIVRRPKSAGDAHLFRERGGASVARSVVKTVRLCGSCAGFFELGVGGTMLSSDAAGSTSI